MHHPTVRTTILLVVKLCKLVGLCIRTVAVPVQQVWIELQYVKAQNHLLKKKKVACSYFTAFIFSSKISSSIDVHSRKDRNIFLFFVYS
jgi:hypothetical protein